MPRSRRPIGLAQKRRISPENWSMPSTMSSTLGHHVGPADISFMRNRENATRLGKARVVRGWTFGWTVPRSGLGLGYALRRNALGPTTEPPCTLVARACNGSLMEDTRVTTRSRACSDTFRQETLV